ncbi:hypothetical protein FEM03_05990 [Phragmitibacter flavus]|uniref:Anaphase-promoting complex subunit 4-like WD40 domain-containing protein n=1 Tax=Phragmitibacter flavus TaxID=2576071 RepID=A0A5R8KHE0_9BACT|nr:hypothetical protein [Phragmitibacter flavus]TLD71687.1 hypothetical protein FEM03_05990 [Phragmitibacter flavus]
MSGLLGVNLDELNQRDAAECARHWRKLFFLSAAVVAVIALLGAATWMQSDRRQHLLTTASERDHAAAEQALVEDDWPLAVAYLDRSLIYWPQNQDAVSLLWSLLRYRPAADSLVSRQRHELNQPVQGLAWSPDSQQLLVRLAEGELRVLNVAAGQFVEPAINVG